MLYRVRSTGAIKNQGGIRKLFPNVSLPRQWNQGVYDILGIDPVEPTAPPSITEFEAVYENGVEQDENGNWKQAWLISPRFPAYEKEDAEGNKITVTQKEQEDAYVAGKLSEKATEKRAQRDSLLAKSDWTQMADSPLSAEVKSEWATYRQSLRDLTDDANWPNVDMPHDPNWVDPTP